MKQTKRKYSLFEEINGKWTRISEHEYPLRAAVHVFQNRLLANALGYENCGPRMLKPVNCKVVE